MRSVKIGSCDFNIIKEWFGEGRAGVKEAFGGVGAQRKKSPGLFEDSCSHG